MAEIAVLIPHYNDIDALIKSIKSIDEVIEVDVFVVDDGSEVKPQKINFEFYKSGKIFIYGYKNNKGIEHALNYGLKKIEERDYKFIGRLDCADTCVKNRFSKQVSYLKKNKNLSMIGTWVRLVDEEGKLLYTSEIPVKHSKIKKKSYLNAMFVHPTICFKSNILKNIGYYPTAYPAAEDYAFFFKVIKKYETANYPEYLVNIEVNSYGISSVKRRMQVKSRIRVIIDNFYFGFYPIYGLIRNILLLLVSRNITTAVKKAIYKK